MSPSSVVPTLRRYQTGWLVPDVVAGLTLLAIAIPEQVATSRLANMPPAAGLYAFIAGSVAFAVIGANANMSVGADSTIAPVFAAGVAGVAATGTPGYTHLVTFMAIIVGAVVTAAGVLRLGWIADFLPGPVVTGILAGIAVEIVVRQLPAVLGAPGGGTTTVGRLKVVFDQRSHFSGWAAGVAVLVLVIVIGGERMGRRFPGALIGVIASTAAVAIFGLRAHGLRVVGSFHAGVPSLGLPGVTVHDVRHLTGTVLTVAFLCVVQTAATARSGGSHVETATELDRDLVGVGAGSVIAAFVGSFPVNASPPRTAVVKASGGQTQATSLIAAIGVGAALALSGLLRDLPQATLGAILLFVATRLFRGRELLRVLRFDRLEFAIAGIALVIVALVGIEQGVVAAILLALAQRTRLSARPRDAVLGREPGTDHWIPPDIGRPTEQVPGILVYLLYAPLWYGNAGYVTARLREAIDSAPAPVHALVIDADGMSDIDYTAAAQLAELARELQARGVRLALARTSHLVHHDLKHSGLLEDIGADHLYASVQDAVTSLSGGANNDVR